MPDAWSLSPRYESGLAMARAAAKDHGETPGVSYFGTTLSVADIDALSDAVAVGFAECGVVAGDRVALFLQNVPGVVVSTLAAWKLGAVVVLVNPMSKERELKYLLVDAGVKVIVTHPELCAVVSAATAEIDRPEDEYSVVVTKHTDFAANALPEAWDSSQASDVPQDAMYLLELIERHKEQRPAEISLRSDSVAVLSYTSGTTGNPKGAMITHGNIAFNAESVWWWLNFTKEDSILAVAPLFHITGFVMHLALSLFGPVKLVLGNRFEPSVMLDLIEKERPTFTIGSITAFISLLNTVPDDVDGRALFASLTKVCTGGAPVPSAVVESFATRFGPYIHNMYGLTETSSAVTGVPLGVRAPIDAKSGALSIGVPIPGTDVRIVGDNGDELERGQLGELVIAGPQVVPGYWNQEEQTALALDGGHLHTGDVGFVDADGWVYLVDRKKDVIIASGYKVWPREVEDVLYGHPSVREAAVIGEPDAYRGETVVAVVSLKPNVVVDPTILIEYCRERLAAYKVPREVRVMSELPKTSTGKILRRTLRTIVDRSRH
jgi:long-chain acyl-CoA synthetase